MTSPVNFGPIVQNAYVVRDLEAAAHHWSHTVGVGPFYVLEHVAYDPAYFRGQPLDLDMSVAIAQWGDIQVELIQQHDATPSIYTEFSARHGEGLQHIGVLTDNLNEHVQRLASKGIEPVQWGTTTKGMRFAYMATDAHPGGMVELIENSPAVDAFFAKIRRAASTWDGTRPLRKLS